MKRIALLVSLFLFLGAGSALAQRKDKNKDKDKQPAAGEPAEPVGPTPEQQQAVVEFTQGQELQKAGDLDGAIAQYEKAYALYPDPELQFLLGEVHRLKGDRDTDVAEYEKALPLFERYLELAPEGRAVEAARQRITALETGIENFKKRQAAEAAEAKKVADQEAADKKAAEDAARAEREGADGMQVGLDISFTAGTEPDLTGIGRLLAGGVLGWGRFALEGHLGFAGFMRVSSDTGVSGRELTLLDLGARYAFRSSRFVGPFVGAGGSFGLITGKPRERRLQNDTMTCATAEGNDCAFAVDKDITGRLALGWGFESSKKTTVALRLDLTYMLFSVDSEQGTDSIPAIRIAKPQDLFAVLVGFEFMHWP